MHEDETVSFRMSWLDERLNFSGNWKEDAKKKFGEDRMALFTEGGRDTSTRQLFQEIEGLPRQQEDKLAQGARKK